MTTGFIDTASINSAAGLIATWDDVHSKWDQQSLFDVTYLLMHSNIKVLPTMENFRGATSYYGYVLERFPQLSYLKPERQIRVKQKLEFG